MQIYDTLSRFTRYFINLVGSRFDKMTIVKPYSISPLSNERFLVFSGFKRESLEELNEKLAELFELLSKNPEQVSPKHFDLLFWQDLEGFHENKPLNERILRYLNDSSRLIMATRLSYYTDVLKLL